MKQPVKLRDIIDGLDMQSEDMQVLLNIKTGEIVSLTSDEIRLAEEEEPDEDIYDWQIEARDAAIAILENEENYISLPSQYDIHEYRIMERFCFSMDDERKKDALLRAISGKGAFGRFKDKIYDLGVHDDWYAYRDNELKKIGIEWCRDHDIEFIDNVESSR
ncbi:UPF0158 family protein [Bacillus sp. FJAT-27445]|uniref:UPF0158 family protein n=1 Tax=Bacillus sp. FJAT-27445 TaxID=1679166 RepID=UPI0007440422|nr:UPF0158 family protein [Bacillus sp. FJAT-27445]